MTHETKFVISPLVAAFLILGVVVAMAVGGAQLSSARCHAGNDFHRYDKARWDYLLKLSPPPKTEEARDIRDKFVAYIARADAQQDCSLF